jgi:hypothetical protein
MTKTKLLQTTDPTAKFKSLKARADRTKGKASSRAVTEIRALVAESPQAMPESWRATSSAMESLIDKVSSGGSKACLLADMDLTRREFGYSEAPAIERVLIDSIVAARLRVVAVEHGYTESGFNSSTSEYWETLLTNAQNRLLRAAETLVKVQRLARNSPTLQINLAANGGQQVNAIST